jgi:putative colanic acid biosynthesis acetyltransferase WcaB
MNSAETAKPGIFQDWDANEGSPKGRFVMLFFRLCQRIRKLPCGLWVLGAPILGIYVLLVHWIMGIEIDYRSEIGAGLCIRHGTGLVVHPEVRMGNACVLRQGVTIGDRLPKKGVPVLSDNVNVGVGALILGPISIGEGAVIGAGSVVIKDVPSRSVVAGNPARVIRDET